MLQLLYDSHRSLLYALKATEVDVLNPSDAAMAISHRITSACNGSQLRDNGAKSRWIMAGCRVCRFSIVVLDPDQPAQAHLLSSNHGGPLSSLSITEFNQVILAEPQTVKLDLSSLTFSALGIFTGSIIKASSDGAHVYGVSGSEAFSLDPSTYAVQSVGFNLYTNGFTDIAVSPNGSQFAAIYGPPFAAGDIAAFYNSSAQYINANVYPDFSPPDDSSVIGATFSPAGKVLVVPLGDSIEFWSAAQGTLLSRLMTPEELHVWAYPEVAVSPLLALDSVTGQTIYAISSSGLTVLTLPEPLDQMPATQWPSAYISGGARSGFQLSLASQMRVTPRKI